jgi:hypothetical protein
MINLEDYKDDAFTTVLRFSGIVISILLGLAIFKSEFPVHKLIFAAFFLSTPFIYIYIKANENHNYLLKLMNEWLTDKINIRVIEDYEKKETNAWIDVNDKLPENKEVVFVRTDNDCIGTAYYHGKKSGWIIYGDEAYKEFGNIIKWRNKD